MLKGYYQRLFCFLCGIYLSLGFIPFFPLISFAQLPTGGFSTVDACLANPTCGSALGGLITTQAVGDVAGATVIAGGIGSTALLMKGMSQDAIIQARKMAINAMCINDAVECQKYTGRVNNANYYITTKTGGMFSCNPFCQYPIINQWC